MVRRQLAIALIAVAVATTTVAHEAAQPLPEPTPADGHFHPAYELMPDAAANGPTQPAETTTPAESAPGELLPPRPPVVAISDQDEDPEPLPLTDKPVPGLGPVLWHGDPGALPKPSPVTRALALYRPGPSPSDEPGILLLSPRDDGEWVEGEPASMRWLSSGPIEKVRIYYSYERCKLAGRSRGEVGKVLADMIPDTHQYTWSKVPWLDGTSLRLRIAGYDADGNRLAAHEIGVRFRPRELTGISDNCIAIIKRHQRLYYYRDGKIKRMHIVSTARSPYWTPTMKPGSYDRRRGAMGKVFWKDTCAWSSMYHCSMPHWMAITSSGSHGIHATSPPFYHRLGSPASHGCVRQHRTDARILFGMVSVGTEVYVF